MIQSPGGNGRRIADNRRLRSSIQNPQSKIDNALMALVQRRWAPALSGACRTSSIPAEFLAALVANESGGNPLAARFETGVFRHLGAVRDGERRAYGAVTARGIEEEVHEALSAKTHEYHALFLTEDFAAEQTSGVRRIEDLRLKIADSKSAIVDPQSSIDNLKSPDPRTLNPTLGAEQVLRELATSWGLTQIMGYHMIGRPGVPADLRKPEVNLHVALELLAEFAERYQLEPRVEFPEFFRCWNTGRPDGKPTFDPDYVEKGLRRMVIYRELA